MAPATASPPMLQHQIIRNAYVVAQSQLLQLAKQMEFDADLSVWEEESSEKMQEFWDQSRQSVADFCARVQYVDSANVQLQHGPAAESRSRNCQVASEKAREHYGHSCAVRTGLADARPAPRTGPRPNAGPRANVATAAEAVR